MNRKDLIFICIALGVIGLFIFLSKCAKEPKTLVAEHHPEVTAQTTRQQCLECHGASGVSPMPLNHPQKGKEDERKPTNCYICHKPPRHEATAAFILFDLREEIFIWPSLLQK